MLKERRKCLSNSLAQARFYLAPALILLGGVSGSLYGYLQSAAREKQEIVSRFEDASQERIAALKKELAIKLQVVSSLRAFVQHGPTSRREFATFAQTLGGDRENIAALGWAPLVPAAQRPVYERQARLDGFPSFQFTERTDQGALLIAASRAEYFPVYFVAPASDNEAALGFDLGSNPERKSALEAAVRTGKLTATVPLNLVQGRGEFPGILVLAPVYANGAGMLHGRTSQLKGMVLGVFTVSDIIAHAKLSPLPAGVSATISDVAAPQAIRTMYQADALGAKVPGSATPAPQLSYSEAFDIAGRTWQIRYQVDRSYLAARHSGEPEAIFALGAMLTALLTVYLVSSSRRTVHIEALVRARTRELALKATQLAREIEERTSAERRLADERTFLKTLVDTIPDCIWVKDPDGRYVFCNRMVEKLYGVQEGDLLGKGDADFSPDELVQLYRANDREVLEAGRTLIREEPGCFPDGVQRLFQTTRTPMYDAANRLLGLLGIGRDITESKKAQELIHKLSHAVEQSPTATMITDAAGNIEYVNARYCSLTGHGSEELVGANPRIVNSGAMPANVYQGLWRTISSGLVWHGDLLNRKKNGELYWEETAISPLTNQQGIITHYLAVKQDITQRMTLERELRESRALLQAVIDSSVDPIYVKDSSGRYLLINDPGLALLGKTRSEVLGKDDCDIFPPEVARRVMAHDKAVLESGALQKYEHSLLTSAGEPRYFSVVKGPLFNADGVISGIFGISRDISERVQADEQLEQKRLLLTTIISTIPDLVFLKDLDGVYLSCNPAFEGFFGALEADIVGKTDYDFVPRAEADFFRDRDLEAIRTGKSLVN